MNGIIIQPTVATAALPIQKPQTVKSKRRSIEASQKDLPVYDTGVKSGPKVLKALEKPYNDVIQNAKMKTHIWLFAR